MKNKNKNIIIVIVALLIVAIAVVILEIRKNSSGIDYGVLLKSTSDPFWSSVAQGISNGAEETGASYQLETVTSDQAAQAQASACRTLLELKPKALIVATISPSILFPCLKEASEAGIIVIDIDANVNQSEAADAGVDIAFTISTDNYVAGTKSADYAVKQLATTKTGNVLSGNVLLIGGSFYSNISRLRLRGFTEQLDKLAPSMRVADSLSANWEKQQANEATASAIKKYPDLKIIFAVNDEMALGAVDAVYAAGKNSDIIIVGVDGSPAAVKSIQAGRLNASVARLPYLIGKQAIKHATSLLNGDTISRFQYVDTFILNKEVLVDGSNPMLKFVN